MPPAAADRAVWTQGGKIWYVSGGVLQEKCAFCLPWSYSSTVQGSAFCSELSGAYKKANSVDG